MKILFQKEKAGKLYKRLESSNGYFQIKKNIKMYLKYRDVCLLGKIFEKFKKRRP